MKPYQKPPMEAAVLPATEMMGRPPQQRPPVPGSRGPPPQYKGRPSAGMVGSGLAYPIPAPRSSGTAMVSSSAAHPHHHPHHLHHPHHPGVMTKLAKPMAKYHPSLSGSETDVSTSTENLTQVRFCMFFDWQKFSCTSI